MSELAVCTHEGCGKHVQKPGYKLCFEHWKAAKHKVAEPASTYGNGSDTSSANGDDKKTSNKLKLLTSTELGERLGLKSRQLNQVLLELGWIEKDGQGWAPTELGSRLCAERVIYKPTGIPFVRWPEALLASRILLNSVQQLLGSDDAVVAHEEVPVEGHSEHTNDFRTRFVPTHRTVDGHWVRSKSEALIDTWLYMSGIAHAYERQLPIDEEVYCDFYIPQGKVYLEFWGLENDPKYLARKKAKQEIYRKYGFNLIELSEEHVKNLDDILPRMLLKFDVTVA